MFPQATVEHRPPPVALPLDSNQITPKPRHMLMVNRYAIPAVLATFQVYFVQNAGRSVVRYRWPQAVEFLSWQAITRRLFENPVTDFERMSELRRNHDLCHSAGGVFRVNKDRIGTSYNMVCVYNAFGNNPRWGIRTNRL